MADKYQTKLDLALTSTDITALIPEDVEPIIVDLVKALSPLISNVEIEQANGKIHEFRRVTAIGDANFEGELAVTAAVAPTYDKLGRTLKIIRAGDGVSHFAKAVADKKVKLYKEAINRAVRAMTFKIEYAIMWAWGKDTATPKDGDIYQYKGLDQELVTNRTDHNGVVTLKLADNMLDGVRRRGVERDPFIWIMSPEMQSKISELETRLRRESQPVDVKGGFRLNSYRGVPIFESSFCTPSGTMTTVTAADDATAGGLVATKTYRWKVAPVTLYGEQAASAEVNHTLGGGITSVKLSFTAYPGALLYKVYRTVDGGGVGTNVLSFVAPAKTYDGVGTVTGAVAFVIDTISDANLGTDVPIGLTDEVIALVNLSTEQGAKMVSLLNQEGDPLDTLIQYIELAKTRSSKDFILETFQALIVLGEKYCSWARRVRLA